MATDPSLSGQTVSLLVAGSQLTVTGAPAGGDHHHVTRPDHDDHDDHPLGRLREHTARALEPVPVHPRSGDPGLADDDPSKKR